jgi:hypothetical protein
MMRLGGPGRTGLPVDDALGGPGRTTLPIHDVPRRSETDRPTG